MNVMAMIGRSMESRGEHPLWRRVYRLRQVGQELRARFYATAFGRTTPAICRNPVGRFCANPFNRFEVYERAAFIDVAPPGFRSAPAICTTGARRKF